VITRRNASKVASRVEEWFRVNARELPWRRGYDPYQVWISELMAQQTRMDVVLRYFPRFVAKFRSVAALAAASEEDVVAVWSGLGYYRRARMLHRTAREIVERFGGAIPREAGTLGTLHGFGRYTAGAVASIAYGQRAPIVDGNVARVVARLEAIEAPWRSRELESRAWEVAELLVARCESPRDLNQGLMELGARVCRPRNPDCGACPLARHCSARRAGATGAYPRPAPKVKATEIEVPVWIISDAKGRLLFRRSEGKLLQGMLQLPVGNALVFPDPLVIADPGEPIGAFTHTITRRRIRFRVFAPGSPERVADSGGEWAWIAPDQLAEHPHPSWVRKAVERWHRR
jgi:A/G-specific adenine glycosylase